MLKAYLQPNPKPVKSGLMFTITCPELGLSVYSKNPSNALCRKIMQAASEHGPEALKVYRGNDLQFTVRNIQDWAGKSVVESATRGLSVQKYNPPSIYAAA